MCILSFYSSDIYEKELFTEFGRQLFHSTIIGWLIRIEHDTREDAVKLAAESIKLSVLFIKVIELWRNTAEVREIMVH